MTNAAAILLVEDNEDDVFLMKRALKAAGIRNPLFVAEDGQKAIDYLQGTGDFTNRMIHPLPALIFLDLKLPFVRGLDVLTWLRGDERFKSIIVVVLTSSEEPSDLKNAYRLGANSYLVKPPTPQQLEDLARAFKLYWLEFNKFPPVS
jgi:CheY-like chemotaxis protein